MELELNTDLSGAAFETDTKQTAGMGRSGPGLSLVAVLVDGM